MNEMISRVARAIKAYEASVSAETGSATGKEYEEGKARAAIEAMREPTGDQESVMDFLVDRRPPSKRWQWIWHEMIEAALK
jgi:hypothetical protein